MRPKLITIKQVSEMTGISIKIIYSGGGGLAYLTRVHFGPRLVRFILQEVEDHIDKAIRLAKK